MTRWNIQYWSWDFKVVERKCVVFQIETAYLVDKRWDCRSCNRRQWLGIDKCNMWNIVDGIAILLQSEHIFLQQVHHILCRETGSSCDNLDDNRVHCCKCKTYYQEMALGIPIRREYEYIYYIWLEQTSTYMTTEAMLMPFSLQFAICWRNSFLFHCTTTSSTFGQVQLVEVWTTKQLSFTFNDTSHFRIDWLVAMKTSNMFGMIVLTKSKCGTHMRTNWLFTKVFLVPVQ